MYIRRVMPDTTEKNKRIEEQYDEMIKSQGTKKNQTPEYKVTSALKTAQNAINKAIDTIKADDALKQHVNLKKLEKIDVTKCSTVKKEAETDLSALIKAVYDGDRIDIVKWQLAQTRKGKSKSSTGDGNQKNYNISSATALATAKKIMEWVSNNAYSTKAKIADEVAKLIPVNEYNVYIKPKAGASNTENETQLKTKIKTIVTVLSRPVAKIDGIEGLGQKLNQEGGKYVKCVVNPPVDLEFK